MPSRPTREPNVIALVDLLAVLVILLLSGIAMYVTYPHPGLAQPLTVAAGVGAALLAAVGRLCSAAAQPTRNQKGSGARSPCAARPRSLAPLCATAEMGLWR
ncbi:hypothetical protein ACFRFU_47415 [Streptomyces sp. NPDC056704]|uniref:hypothetical protein n=1 Tax=Streptomyces sp. NPDC056704 TaxID=3345917 RepID=UPI00367CDFD8